MSVHVRCSDIVCETLVVVWRAFLRLLMIFAVGYFTSAAVAAAPQMTCKERLDLWLEKSGEVVRLRRLSPATPSEIYNFSLHPRDIPADRIPEVRLLVAIKIGREVLDKRISENECRTIGRELVSAFAELTKPRPAPPRPVEQPKTREAIAPPAVAPAQQLPAVANQSAEPINFLGIFAAIVVLFIVVALLLTGLSSGAPPADPRAKERRLRRELEELRLENNVEVERRRGQLSDAKHELEEQRLRNDVGSEILRGQLLGVKYEAKGARLFQKRDYRLLDAMQARLALDQAVNGTQRTIEGNPLASAIGALIQEIESRSADGSDTTELQDVVRRLKTAQSS